MGTGAGAGGGTGGVGVGAGAGAAAGSLPPPQAASNVAAPIWSVIRRNLKVRTVMTKSSWASSFIIFS
ncbi:hypothetical protein F2P46_07910 [Massilia sp. CCM 8734]|nr:hypothetical protein [Massilia sp. CCM 8734]